MKDAMILVFHLLTRVVKKFIHHKILAVWVRNPSKQLCPQDGYLILLEFFGFLQESREPPPVRAIAHVPIS